jgi:hypothetical protein
MRQTIVRTVHFIRLFTRNLREMTTRFGTPQLIDFSPTRPCLIQEKGEQYIPLTSLKQQLNADKGCAPDVHRRTGRHSRNDLGRPIEPLCMDSYRCRPSKQPLAKPISLVNVLLPGTNRWQGPSAENSYSE